jgi:hypothetical protein
MNQRELDSLNNRFISHEARSLYVFEIRPNADASFFYTIDYNRLTEALTILGHDGKPFFIPSAEQINSYITDLINIGMMELAPGSVRKYEDYHGLTVRLTVAQKADLGSSLTNLSGEITGMSEDWTPSPDFVKMARIGMLIDATYTSGELSDFRSYWMVRPNARHTASQWDQKFVSYLKRRHSMESDRVTVYREKIGLQRK